MTKFQVGRTYYCSSICDSECIFTFKIISWTAQSVVIKGSMATKRRKVRVYEGCEQIDPLGRYSMAPILSASRVLP